MAIGLSDIAKGLGLPILSALGEDTPGSHPFIIEQTTGSQTRVVLKGRALPLDRAAWGVTMRTALTFYQGNPEGTQQVMGPEYPPLTIEGKWKDRFIEKQAVVDGSETAITTSAQLVELFYRMTESGNEVRVQWATEVRVGVIKSFVPTWDRLQDVGWKLEFEWHARNAAKTKAKAAAVFASPDDLLKKLNDVDDLLAQIEDFPKAITATLVSDIDAARQQIGKLFAVVRAFNTVLALPGTLIGAIAAAVGSIIAQMGDEASRMSETSSQKMSISTQVATMLQTEDNRRDMAVRVVALSDAALQLQEQTQAQVNPSVAVQVVTQTDKTLYDLAMQYYGNPDMAAFLGAYNGISGALVTAGTVMLIPQRPPPQAAPDPLSGGVVVHGR